MTRLEQMIHDLCPNGVEWNTLGDVCGVLRGKRLTKSELSESEKYPVYHGGIEPLGFYKEYNREAKTVMIINVGASAGTIGYSNERFWSSDGCFCLGHSERVLSKFVYYYLQTREKEIKSRVRYAGIPTLDSSIIKQLSFPLPPLEIQEKIVEFLDAFSALAAELQAELQKRRTQYEYYRTLLLAPPHADSVDGSTDGCNWEWKTLGEICELVTKQTGFDYSNTIKPALLTEKSEDSIPFLQTRNFSGRDFDYNTEYYVPNEIVNQFPRIVLDKECLLMSIVGSIGNVGLFPGTHKCFLGGAICVLKFKEGVNIPYVYEYLSSCYGQKLIKSKIKGSGQSTITIEDIRNFKIPFPSEADQVRITDILGRFSALTSSLSEGIPAEQAAQQKRYEYFRDLLLTFDRKAE